jgi:hypothetical protein
MQCPPGRLAFVVFLLLLRIFPAQAQGTFLDGYLITPQNDTLKGLIRYEDWETSPTWIELKASPTAEPRRFTTEQAKLFFITSRNELYVSQQATIRLVSNVVYSTEPNHQVKIQAFMQKILGGRITSLYRFVAEQDGRERFFVEKNGQLTELVNYTYQFERGDKVFEKKVDDYKSQLQALCSDVPTFNALLPPYEEKPLRNYLRTYNACFQDESIVYESKPVRPELAWAVNGGVELLKDEFFENTSQVAPSFGGTFRVSLPRKNYNRFFRLNLNLTPGANYTVVENFKEVGRTGLFKTLEIGGGSYLGSRKIRPYAYASLAYQAIGGGGSVTLYLNGGLSFNRRADLEFSHFVAPVNLKLALPRIAFHYYFDVPVKE